MSPLAVPSVAIKTPGTRLSVLADVPDESRLRVSESPDEVPARVDQSVRLIAHANCGRLRGQRELEGIGVAWICDRIIGGAAGQAADGRAGGRLEDRRLTRREARRRIAEEQFAGTHVDVGDRGRVLPRQPPRSPSDPPGLPAWRCSHTAAMASEALLASWMASGTAGSVIA